ncbi:outer membrane protein assembly factor BamD [candidate division KSB1 bacterium]|nr:outer membrane protein assembly factor BamD [candidate division KSB1 bacterium]
MLKKLLFITLSLTIIVSCGGNRPKKDLSAEERMKYAMKEFEDGDYLDAKTEFRIIVLNFPGHNIVDKAQYYLAECHFELKEYILAIAEYEKLTRMFPNSSYVDDAMYKVGLANFKLSPKYSLDQTYTLQAIEKLQRFMEEYPQSDYMDEATEIMNRCREKLAKKEYKNGELYRKLAYYDAAILYFESVVNNYYDTDFAKEAQYWLGYCLKKDSEYDRAREEYRRYLQKYPEGKRVMAVKNSLQEIAEIQSNNDDKEN